MDKNEQRICWYSSVLIVFMVNTPKLLALRQNGIIAHYWHFNLAELLFQEAYNLLFCWVVFYLNLQPHFSFAAYRDHKRLQYWAANILVLLLFILIGSLLQKQFFPGNQLPQIYFLGNFARLGLSDILIMILVRIILLVRESKKQAIENEQLKTAYMATELELLKEQMNPHFLFNSLSSLSGVIRENPELAQKYVRSLSNVFRYTLTKAKVNLVTVEEELVMLRSFTQLIEMRLENAFELVINIEDVYLPHKLPHLSLQPLVENAVKHNAATIAKPLKVFLYVRDNYLVVSNSIWEIPVPESSNGLGLANLNERFKIMTGKEIEISKNDGLFIVKLPLLLS